MHQVTIQLYMPEITCVYHTEMPADVMHLSSGPVLSCLHHIQSTCKLCKASGYYRQGVGHYLDSANHRHVKEQRNHRRPQAPFQRDVRYTDLQNICSCRTCLSLSPVPKSAVPKPDDIDENPLEPPAVSASTFETVNILYAANVCGGEQGI
jgi:hypothetical protein